MKLGSASAILPAPSPEEVVRFASVEGSIGAERRCGPSKSPGYQGLFLLERREG